MNDRQLDHLLTVVETPDLTGTPYRLEDEIGRGGMGVVYRAFDTRLERRVALKVLARGAEEPKVLASLEHPGIVAVHDAGMLADGRMYVAMRLVEGMRLDGFLRTGPGLRERLAVFLKVCEAAAYAHSRGIVHRDIKPANIQVGAYGEVLLLDWGVARAQGAGDAAGTPGFMAPEQARGEAGARSDVYALGRVLAFLVGEDGPRPLRAIAARASAAEPADRYAEVAALMRDIARFQDQEAVEAYRESIWERIARFYQRNQTLLLLITVYALVRFVIFFWPAR